MSEDNLLLNAESRMPRSDEGYKLGEEGHFLPGLSNGFDGKSKGIRT